MTQKIQNKIQPRLSIIIVTKNDYENLLRTYNNLQFSPDLRQNVQLILIDGDSTDETKTFIKSHSSDFNIIISEPDKGIYDAMNKGIDLTEGEWTIFMNSGDTFADSKVMERVIHHLNPGIDVLYGDCVLKYPGFNILRKASVLKVLWKGMITTHQSFIIKTTLLKENKFNLDYKLGADFEQVYNLYKQGITFKYVPIVISAVDTTGVSNRKMSKSLCEHYQILRNNDKLSIGKHFYYFFNFLYLKIINIFRLLFPQKLYYYFIRSINRKSLI